MELEDKIHELIDLSKECNVLTDHYRDRFKILIRECMCRVSEENLETINGIMENIRGCIELRRQELKEIKCKIESKN